MILMSQNKKVIMECAKLIVEKNVSFGKGDKYAIVGIPTVSSLDGAEVLGTYAEEKLALDELERIMTALKSGETVNYMK